MRSVRFIFIVLECCAILAVTMLAFKQVTPEYNFFKAAYIVLFTLLAVAMQKEQQQIKEMIKEDEYIEQQLDIKADK